MYINLFLCLNLLLVFLTIQFGLKSYFFIQNTKKKSIDF